MFARRESDDSDSDSDSDASSNSKGSSRSSSASSRGSRTARTPSPQIRVRSRSPPRGRGLSPLGQRATQVLPKIPKWIPIPRSVRPDGTHVQPVPSRAVQPPSGFNLELAWDLNSDTLCWRPVPEGEQGKFPLPPYLKPTVIFRQDGAVKFHSRPSGLEQQVAGDAALAARVAKDPDIMLSPSQQRNRPKRRQPSRRGVRQPPPQVGVDFKLNSLTKNFIFNLRMPLLQKQSRRAVFEELFGEFSNSDAIPTDFATSRVPHPVSDSEMEVVVNDDDGWEDVLPAADEGPSIVTKVPDG